MRILNQIVILVFVCAFYVFALPADAHGKDEHGRTKKHEDSLSDKPHEIDGEHNPDYDKEAFLGDMKDDFDGLSPEEAQRRLKLLIKKVDSDSDGYVTPEELKAWVKEVFRKKMLSGMENDHGEKDKDGDGFISWDEFLKDSYGEEMNADEDEEMKKMIERDRKHYDIADENKDGKLTAAEFGTFLHPETNDKMRALNAEETLQDMDHNKDGKLDLNEFLGDYKDPDSANDPEPEWVREETERFKNELDKDGDGFLNTEELMAWVAPDTDGTIVEEEVKHLIEESDDNKDKKLSLDEIIAHHDIFTGSEATDYGQALPKEEL